MIGLRSSGNFNKSTALFKRLQSLGGKNLLDAYGRRGVEALRKATPVDTGKTADSWDYVINFSKRGSSIVWTNSNRNDGISIAIILQYGHGTRTGGYVEGVDYINPALRPIFDDMEAEIWREVTK